LNFYKDFKIMKTLVLITVLVWTGFCGMKTDTLYTSGGAYLTRLSTPSAGISNLAVDSTDTRIITADSAIISNLAVDSSDHRIITSDSATIPILKGTKTFRDSSIFTGGIKGVRLTMDSIYTAALDVAGTINSDSGYRINGGDLLSVYDTESFACSLFDGATYRAVVTAKYTIIGNVVHLSIPAMSGTITASTTTYLRTIPAAIRPTSRAIIGITTVMSNSVYIVGQIITPPSAAYFVIRKSDCTYLDAGTGGIKIDQEYVYKFNYRLD